MAHFAKLDNNNIVTQVIVINNEALNSFDEETSGIIFCQSLSNGNWKQTSYNGKIRKNYAGIGYSYDEIRDAFIPPKPFQSWILNEETCLWEAPTPMPIDDKRYIWDEFVTNWVEVTE